MDATLDLHPADAFIARDHKLFIDGAWVDPREASDPIPVLNPATGAVIGHVPDGGARDVAAAVAAARRAFETGPWPAMSPSAREKLLLDLADLCEAEGETISHMEVRDNGMAMMPAGMLAPVMAAKTFRYYAGWVTKIAGSVLPVDQPPFSQSKAFAYVRKEPVGVCAAITPWNYPFMMAVMKLAPALATGCTVVLKPAELAPFSALFLAELCQRAGVPPGVVNVVTGYGETAGAALSAHPDVDKIAFTGSTEVGKIIVRAAAGNLKKVSLELGGKNPFIVMKDADLPLAVATAAKAAFFLQGQNCQCGSRMYVHASLFDRFVADLSTAAQAMKIGDGFAPGVQIGPMISADQRARVEGYIAAGEAAGAERVSGGRALARPGFFLEPTVFARTTHAMSIVREEIFGPVASVMPFDTDDLDAIAALANDTTYGLIASVWTKDLSNAIGLSHRIKAGNVAVNNHGMTDITVPFGGYRQSGWGREFGPESLEPYLQAKTVTLVT